MELFVLLMLKPQVFTQRRSKCILAREVVAIAGILGSSLWSLSFIGVVGAATGSAPTNLYNSLSKDARGIAISYLAKLK